jgi:serine/threonine-protein kinase/endoribonuclease IRE1
VRLTEYFDRASSGSSSSASSSSASLVDLATAEPERDHARLTKAVDLFALGCLYFWVLMGGQHPYGEVYDRESNIVKGEIVNLASLDILGEEGYEAKNLVGTMLSMKPASRYVA